MSLARKIAFNTAWQAAGKFLGLGLSLVTAALVMRYLGVAGWGRYSTILAFLEIFGIVMDFGLYIILIKKIAQINDQSGALVNNIFTMRLVSGLIFLSLAPLVALAFPYSAEIKIGIAVTTLFYLFISLNQLLSAIFQKFLATYWIALAEFLGKTALLVASILCIYWKLNLLWIMAAVVLGAGVNFLINFIASRKYFKIKLRCDLKIWRQLIKEAWPVALSIAFALIYFKGDMVILSWFKSAAEVGIYGAPYKMLEVLVAFPAMFVGLALPVLTAKWQARELGEFQQVLQKCFNFLSLIVLPLVVGTWLLAEPLMVTLGGKEFIESAPVLQILIIATGMIFFGTLFTYLVVAVDRQRTMLWGYGLVALSSLIMYLYLIPKYSYWGAAGVTVYSETAVLIISVLIVYQATKARLNFVVFGKSLLSCLVMAGLLLWLKGQNLFLLIGLGVIVYFGVLFIVKGVSKEQIKEIMINRF